MSLGIERKARQVAHRSLGFLVGGLLAAVGTGFLTAAAWIVLCDAYGSLLAAQILGAVYLLAGGVTLLLTARKPPSPRRPDAVEAGAALAEAFLVGMDAGRRAGSRS